MRRLSSVLISAAMALTGVVATSSPAAAASGEATVKQSGLVAPAAIRDPEILRILRLNQTNSFLVLGFDKTTGDSNLHLWKITDNLTVDASFGAVNLGNSFKRPTAANSSCMNSMLTDSCLRVQSFTVNEITGVYAVAINRQLTVGVGMTQRSTELTSIATGNLRTGAITASGVFVSYESTGYDATTDFAAYGATNALGTTCSDIFGAAYQSIPLSSSVVNAFNMTLRPDGSLLVPINCEYSQSSQNSETAYTASGLIALKTAGQSLVRDASFGTNGVLVTFNDPTKCGQTWNAIQTDTSITSSTSQKLFALLTVPTFARVTQHPWNNSITNYNGCLTSGSTTLTGLLLHALKTDGTVMNTTTFNTGITLRGRFLIDTEGRWNSLMSTGSGNSIVYSLFRVGTNGQPDTSLGANGQNVLTGVPTTVTMGSTSVPMSYSLSGIAQTATGFYFIGFTTASPNRPNSFNCSQVVTWDSVTYPYYLDIDQGLLTTYGTNGLGEGDQYLSSSTEVCGGSTAVASFINARGQHAVLRVMRAVGSQAAGIRYTIWDAAPNVTAGGDGSGVIGGASGRTDTTVYARRLPATTQTETLLNVLTRTTSRTQLLRTRTPKVCIALSQAVLMVKAGTCRVEVVDRSTLNIVRRLSTRVRTTDTSVGTSVTTESSIRFRAVSSRLSAQAKAQVAALAASASSAKRVILVGHAALLTDNAVSNNRIALQRAAAVKAELQRLFKAAGVTVPVSIVSAGSKAPISSKRTERSQADNRRVEVYIVP